MYVLQSECMISERNYEEIWIAIKNLYLNTIAVNKQIYQLNSPFAEMWVPLEYNF